MSIFEDKEYTKMDWLTQAVEPIVSSLNDKLAALPKEFIVTYNDIAQKAFVGYSDLRVNQSDIVSHCFRKNGLIYGDLEREIQEVFLLVIEGKPVLDMVNNVLHGGTIKIIKTKDHFEEKQLLEFMGRKGFYTINRIDTRRVEAERANEILELLGDMDAALKSKSIGVKCQAIAGKYETVMRDNLWNIRNVDLSDRIGEWIYQFLVHGNLAALTNFCKFKVMTHNNQAIYSIQEEPI